MTIFDLNERHRWSTRLRRSRAALPAEEANWAVLTGWTLSATLCLALAGVCPASAMPWMLAGLLTVSGFVWLGAAITQAGPPADAPHLTAWDAALFSFAASFCVQSAVRLGLYG